MSTAERPGRLVDLSHHIEHAMVTYPGLPGPTIGDHLSFEDSAGVYATGFEFQIGRIDLVANTGTYLDTPAHRFREGDDLADLDLARCADLPAVVLDAGPGAIGPGILEGEPIEGAAVLFRTGWDRHWRTPFYADVSHPFITEDAASALVARGARLVGIDSINVDGTTTGARPIHTTLLAAGVLIVEHLTGLDALPAEGARFTAAPPMVRGMASFPVRAFAVVP